MDILLQQNNKNLGGIILSKIKVMVNGIPGNMSLKTAQHVVNDDRFELIAYSLTGPEITQTQHNVDSVDVDLIIPNNRDVAISKISAEQGFFISVDYTHPSVVNSNAEFYCKHNLPFVMGTTGGNRKLLEDIVRSSSICAIIAPNMAKQIVGFQAMIQQAAETFPDLFKGYSLEIKESHQKGKADTSGTAKAMVKYFNQLGVSFSEKDIIKEREPEIQKTQLKVPKEFLSGHGWHTYTLLSQDNTVRFAFTHNVNGRDVYAQGTLDAIDYLHKKINQGEKSKAYTMIDVLKNSG